VFQSFFGTPLPAGCNGVKEMEAASSFCGDHQGSIGSHHSESEALTGEPGDAMMGEEHEEASVTSFCNKTPVVTPEKTQAFTP